METVAGSGALELKVTPTEPVTPIQTVNPKQQVYPVQPPTPIPLIHPVPPVFVMSLNPPQKDYLLLSIVSTFFFMLLAVPAILFSFKTREANFLGNLTKAKKNSRLALGFSIASILVGSTLIISSIVVGLTTQKK